MNRRDALRLLATGAALQLAPVRMFALLREARAAIGDQTGVAPRTLNAHQQATVTAMAEMIIPRTETPGATDVGACDFIDLMLTEWYEDAERVRFLKGLSDVDGRSQDLFRKDFVACTADEQGAILEMLGEQMVAEQLARRVVVGSSEPALEPPANFYSMLRWLTLTAYYTSETGATQELHFQIIPDRFDACAEVQLSKLQVSTSGKEEPEFQ
jgi:hypothetical protein